MANLAKLPPVKEKKTKALAALERVFEDEAKLKKARDIGEGIVYYDYQSPEVRRRRENARQVFEGYCKLRLRREDLLMSEMWNAETFIERSCDMLAIIAVEMKGNISEKPRVDGLYQVKDGLYWWAVRNIPSFSKLYSAWHAQTTAAIHKIGLNFGFETGHRQKKNLTDIELALFYRQILTFKQRRENWKQHYAAWLLVYITAVRPGSFTVCPGYAAGDKLPNGQPREIDETLRWSDIEFVRMPHGIDTTINFKYSKGQRDPYSRKMLHGQRKFTLPPLRSDRYEFDISLILLAIGFSRGLFRGKTIDELFAGNDKYLAKNADVDSQPVFLACDQGGNLRIEAMKEKALNPRLQDMCTSVGLLHRNTIYSFRRTAIVETKRKFGTEAAQELASHVPEGRAIYAYDHNTVGDLDLMARRFGTKGYSNEELRKLFSQAEEARVRMNHPTEQSVQKQLDDAALAKVVEDEQYVAKENELRELVQEAAAALDMPMLLLNNVSAYQKKLLASDKQEDQELLTRLDTCLKERKNLKRVPKRTYMQVVKQEMIDEHKRQLKVAKSKARGTGTQGRLSGVERSAQDEAAGLIEESGDTASALLEGLRTDGADSATTSAAADDRDDDTVDEEALQNTLDKGKEAPPQWEALPDQVTLDYDIGDGGEPSEEGRLAFVKQYAALSSVPASNLNCVLCQLDDTATMQHKTKTYTMNQLDRHLKSHFHDRESQLLRAFVIDSSNKMDCPFCDDVELTKANVVGHFNEEHSEYME